MLDQLKNLDSTLQLLILVAAGAFLPLIVTSFTSFLRITIVLVIFKQAMELKTAFPAMAIMAVALILTLYSMQDTFAEVYDHVKVPYQSGAGVHTVFDEGIKPLKKFMAKQTIQKDIEFFAALTDTELPDNPETLNTKILLPAFLLSEMRTAFNIGFIIYIPFIIVDVLVANFLLALGLMMLPPMGVSLPLKMLIFILIDGWSLLFQGLIFSFN